MWKRSLHVGSRAHIGYGAPHKHNTRAAHGEPLGERRYVSPSGATASPRTPSFSCQTACASTSGRCGHRGQSLHKVWLTQFESYRRKYPDLANEIERMQRRELPVDWDAELALFSADAKGLATRDSSGKVLNAIASHYRLADRRLYGALDAMTSRSS